MSPYETFLTTDELADRLRTSRGKIQNDRSRGCGPVYLKLGSRVLYPLSLVEAYERARLVDPNERGKAHAQGLPLSRRESAEVFERAAAELTGPVATAHYCRCGAPVTALAKGKVPSSPATKGTHHDNF
jgi:hypothetical protein